ncbi:XRE family transcriptional regulator [Burkholderia sp. Bp9140]|uniref:helix-turn-helix domain-containing protein n=1 Tax=Burkholderia sp. Bp9140 TaxID=2184572 RepID=UPI000F57439B|nr:XRE family transcriptional regulator [Burkholderia sp. Bp9140]RQR51595.1 XRE family transcriptional regulator [Burkholderia sp. Bp9140]
MVQVARDGGEGTALDDFAFDRFALGNEIRKLRKARSKTLAEIALATGRSISFISQLERGRAEISISDLRRVAQTLGVPLGWFFVSETKPTAEVGRIVRAGARRRLGSAIDGLVEELLSPNIGGAFETFLSTFAAGASLAEPALRDTEEEGYVVKGQLDIWIGGNHFEVSAGDSFRIAREEFQWANRGDTDAVVVWVIAPPTY